MESLPVRGKDILYGLHPACFSVYPGFPSIISWHVTMKNTEESNISTLPLAHCTVTWIGIAAW